MPTASSIHALLAHVIDYAGLFPPAALSMQQAVETYARHRAGEHVWILGRFICPSSRLEEFSRLAAPLMPGTFATSGYREHVRIGEPWGVSIVADEPIETCLDRIAVFNETHIREDAGLAEADALEIKITSPRDVEQLSNRIPDSIQPFLEVPSNVDPRGLIAAMSGQQVAAKIRTGGVTPEAFPPPTAVAAFIHACAAADVPFKATAGLHHPIRAEHPLTYEPGCPRGVMHGFLNVFLAAAFVRADRMKTVDSIQLLVEHDPLAFRVANDHIIWKGRVLETEKLRRVRESFALSFGSCSFDEPVEDLQGLGLLD